MSPSAISSQDIAEAVLQSVNGFYPETDEIASAELTPNVLPAILSSLEQSILRTKEDIRQLKDAHKNEIASWTTEARSLHDNLASTRAAAAEVKQLEQEGTELEEKVRDSSLQQELLSSEIRFNEELADILTSLNFIQSLYDEAQELAVNGSLLPASEQIEQADHALTGFQGMSQVLAVELLKQRSNSLKFALTEAVEEYWISLMQINPAEQSITILTSITVANVEVTGTTIAETLKSMKILKERTDRLQRSIDSIFISPRLDERPRSGDVISFSVDSDNNTIRVSGKSSDLSTTRLYDDLRYLFDFLEQKLDPIIIKQLTKTLVPSLTTRLQSTYLPSHIPTSLSDLALFENVLRETHMFEEYLERQGWIKSSDRDLRDWVVRAPKLWLNKKREGSLDSLKQSFIRGFGTPKTVERIETMVKVNGVFEEPKDTAGVDNWDAKWDSEEETHSKSAPTDRILMSRTSTSNPAPEPRVDEDEEVVSGWGLDDDLNFDDDEAKTLDPSESLVVDTPSHAANGLEEKPLDVDWEWGDDDQDGNQKEGGHPERPVQHQRSRKTSVAGITGEKKGNSVTLKETYQITYIPQGLLEIIQQVLQDADDLTSDVHQKSAISSSAGNMLQIPSVVISGYRALSSLFYAGGPNSAMSLYNDCVWLEDQLSTLQTSRRRPIDGKTLDLTVDRKALSAFGKRAYSKELESQRLIVSDLMDGAQGFASCTDYPLSAECETAVSGVVDRIKACYESWRDTLSQSNLYQAIGSLLNTVATKFINDIEDLSDISADESTKLAALCGEIIKLEVLFTPSDQATEAVPVTAVYCDHWLKFQYLANILECTMVDLMHLWREGTLVDFEKDELIDLVKALFADGEKRTKVIDELRRG